MAVCFSSFSSSSLSSSSSSFFLFCWMTIVDFLIKKSFCLRKSLLNIEVEIYPSFWDHSHWRQQRQIHLPKGKLAWDFSIGFQKIYLFTFFDQVIHSHGSKLKRYKKEHSASLPYSLATCHPVPLLGGNWGVPVSCVSFQRCFMQI